MPRSVLPLLLLLIACGTLPPRPRPPIAVAPSLAFAEARRHQREGDAAGALEAARTASQLAPDWIAPRRFLDDLARDELRTPQVLAGWRARLRTAPDDAQALYLAGRLEGLPGDRHLRRAASIDPREGWVWHGRGWNAFRRGELDRARRHGRRASALARDPYERAYFAWARSRYALEAGDEDAAAQLLLARLADPDTDDADRTWLAVALVRLELQSGDPERRRVGTHRALHLLEGDAPLLGEELGPLVEGVALWGHADPGRTSLHLALSRQDDALRAEQRGRLLLLEQESPLAMALLERAARQPDQVPGQGSLRRLRFAVGDPAAEVEAWRAAQPAFVLQDGSPRDPALARLVGAARSLGPPGGWTPGTAREFGEALLDAGWFEEARAFASRLPAGDLEQALELDARAHAGRGVIDSLGRLTRALDRGGARQAPAVQVLPGTEPGRDDGAPIEDLEGLLVALAPALARAAPLLGGPTHAEPWAQALAASPIIDYGLAGEVVHPGPRFSDQDEARGLGRRGDEVPGLAPVLARLGRFGLFGDGLGQVPDGALLRRLWIEPRAGQHLGVAWTGTVAWCDGADLPPRAARAGTSIAGAALHEGYWIDVSVLRQERARWVELHGRFARSEALERALAVPPLAVGENEARASTDLLLGAADRLRLAVMRDRAGPPTLEELCAVTATHEEGHLCDRARFFPFEQHWLSVLGLFASAGFSPSVLAQRLEERAQLVALCVVADPRVPLVDLLQAAEDGGAGTTPHGAAYARLCGRFLKQLGRAADARPGDFATIDRRAFLGQQTHRLTPEQVREVALELARRRGLVR